MFSWSKREDIDQPLILFPMVANRKTNGNATPLDFLHNRVWTLRMTFCLSLDGAKTEKKD
jgi:hypothetical protein